MPGEMGRHPGVSPARFGRGKKFESFPIAPLHLHDMGYDMNGARMPRIERQRAARDLFGAAVLTVFFEAESVHRKNACVAGSRAVPRRQHVGDAIAQHGTLTEAEVERVGDRKRDNVAWPLDRERAVTLECESLIALQPSTGGGSVTTRGFVGPPAGRLGRSH